MKYLEKVVIIIPTYNEAAIIGETIAQIFQATVDAKFHDIHILIFDSASNDDTQNIVRTLQPNYPTLHLQAETQKTGLGSAYLQAMEYALTNLEADIVFEFDADLSHQPKYILPMLKTLENCDVALGSRYIHGGAIPQLWGLHRKLFSILGNYVARLVLTPRYKDFTSGFRATRAKFLKQVLPSKFLSNNYAYKLQLLWLLHKQGAKIIEYPIEFIDRETGESKLPKNSIADSLRVLMLLRWQGIKRYTKMCLIGTGGLIIQFLVYNLLRYKLPLFAASALAVSAAILHNLLLNHRITFANSSLRALNKLQVSKFILYSLFMIGLQSAWLQIGVLCLGMGFWKENILILTGVVLGSIANYLVYAKHIWSGPQKVFS